MKSTMVMSAFAAIALGLCGTRRRNAGISSDLRDGFNPLSTRPGHGCKSEQRR
jgi:hypothetical protein